MDIYNTLLLQNFPHPEGWKMGHNMYHGTYASNTKAREQARIAWDKQALMEVDDEGFYLNRSDKSTFVRPSDEDDDATNAYYKHMMNIINTIHDERPIRMGVFMAPSSHGIQFRNTTVNKNSRDRFRARLGRTKWNREPGQKRKKIGVFDLQDVIMTVCYLNKDWWENYDVGWTKGLIDAQCWVADEIYRNGKTPIGVVSPYFHASFAPIPDELMAMQLDKLKDYFPGVKVWSKGRRDFDPVADQRWVDIYSSYI